MTTHVYFSAVLLLLAFPAASQGFDWTLLNGQWAESVEQKFACRPDNLHHKFEVSANRKTITFQLDRKWKIGTGQRVESYSATVVKSAPNVLTLRYGPELGGLSDAQREWQLRFIGPGTYRWRLTAWPEGQYNQVIGVKCNP